MFGRKEKEIITCIVIEVISEKSLENMNSVLQSFNALTDESPIINREYLEKCPRNSIIAKVPNSGEYIILYPFFSSHFALPVKPGEHVWCFFPEGFGKADIGYWMSRKSTDEFIEDANYTYGIRSSHKHYFEKLINRKRENSKEKYYSVKGRDFGKYEEILDSAVGSKNHVFENIARFKKKPGDLLVQGSNNSQILLTNGKEENTGTLILTSGRGADSSTSSQEVINQSGKKENNKASSLSQEGTENEIEGQINVTSDRATLVLSENPVFLNEDSGFDFEDASYFFTRSDIARMEARQNILMSTESVSISADRVSIAGGGEPYIRYSDFESLIKNIVSDINTLALQIAEINGTLYTFGVSGQAASQGPLAPLQALFGQIPAVLNPPGSGDSEKVYNETINKRLNEIQDCKSEKIFGA
jgi:hypothetical protein